jgi:hypothetical protein
VVSSSLIGSRRQPTVPIAVVSGHSGSFCIASVHARQRYLAGTLAASGGASRLAGGHAPP